MGRSARYGDDSKSLSKERMLRIGDLDLIRGRNLVDPTCIKKWSRGNLTIWKQFRFLSPKPIRQNRRKSPNGTRHEQETTPRRGGHQEARALPRTSLPVSTVGCSQARTFGLRRSDQTFGLDELI